MPNGKAPARLIRFGQKLNALLPAYEIRILHSAEPRQGHALNMLADDFRSIEGAEWFVWFDPNLRTEPADIALLLSSGRAVCGALHATDTADPEWNGSFYPDMKADDNGVLAVAELAGGAKVFHHSVFDIIDKAAPDLRYIFDSSGRSLIGFFQDSLWPFGEYLRLLSPASHMDALCRKHGVCVYTNVKAIIKPSHGRKEPYRPWEHTRKPAPVCAEDLPEVKRDNRPIRVVLQYCDKDSKQAERLTSMWGKLGSPIHYSTEHSNGDKYPKGPNDTALRIIRESTGSAKIYKAVVLVEPDCVPVAPDWLDQLSEQWDRASAAGKLIMGSWHPVNLDHPTLGHINGNLMFDPRLASLVDIPDVPDNRPWDTFLADVFEPHWCRTGLIRNLNRHRTATLGMMTVPECGTKPPVLIHGVRDESAWNLAKSNTK